MREEVHLSLLLLGWGSNKSLGREMNMTRKLLLAVMAVTLLTVPMALAQVEIVSLGGTAADSFVFTGTGSGNWTLGLVNPCPAGQCTATGEGPALGTNGFYSFNTTGVTITGTYNGGNDWTISQSGGAWGGAILFNIGSTTGGNNLLSGDLQLVSLDQTGKIGSFNDNLIANLTNLTGTLAQYFTAAGGIYQFDIDLTTCKGGTCLSGLGSGQTFKTDLGSSGEITSTPEPGTFVMLGAGLLGVGGYLRRKIGV
jgi:hypothetical protein